MTYYTVTFKTSQIVNTTIRQLRNVQNKSFQIEMKPCFKMSIYVQRT